MNAERSLLADVVEELFATHSTLAYAGEVGAEGFGAELWDRVEGLGLTLAAVPESLGGTGATIADEVEILRAAGRHAAPLPLLETGLLAGWLLTGVGLAATPGPMTVAPLRPGDRFALRREGGSWQLTGEAAGVPAASIVERLVVLAEDPDDVAHVAIVPTAACEITPRRTIADEWRDGVACASVPLPDEAVAPAPPPIDREQLRRRAALGGAIQMLGALEGARDLTIRHVREREQFGRPLARFQAIQGHIAQIGRDVALADAAVEAALPVLFADADLPLLEVAAAKVVCGEAATRVSATAHQVHGAIGITREHPLQLLTRRLWAWRDDAGAATPWADALGEDLLRQPGGAWAQIAPVATRREE